MNLQVDAAHPAVIARLLHDYDLHPKKSAGQNFFCDGQQLDAIVDAAGIAPQDWVLEIGPGLGALTQRLAARAARVVAVELDKGLLAPLAQTVGDMENVQIVNADFLKLCDDALDALLASAPGLRVVSNLPYCITTDAMQKLFLSRLPIQSITVLVQREAAQRICALPGSKQYGVTAMMCAYYTQAKTVCSVPPQSFFPRPNVESVVMDFRFRSPRPCAECPQEFIWRVARGVLSMRRKTIFNNLCAAGFSRQIVCSALQTCGIQENLRAEILSVETIVRLAETLFAASKPARG
jgi:16S rRNA (adenine1518-N6/adenine1519-N6)-dimethyltransferase